MDIDVNLITKLFDTLQQTTRDLTAKVEKQTEAIIAIGHNIRSIKESNNTHIEDAKDTASGVEETKGTTSLIWDKVRKMNKAIVTMIIVVCVAFSLLTVSYIFVRNSVESIVAKEIKEIINKDLNNQDLLKEIETLKKQLKDLKDEHESTKTVTDQ